MFKVVANLLMHKQINFEEGEVSLLKQNVAFFPFENLFDMCKIIDSADKEYELYLASKKLGATWIKNLFKEFKMKKISDQVKWGENVFTLAGLGKMSVVNWDVKAKRMVYRVTDSVMSKYYGKSTKPVDTIARGWFAGAAQVFFQCDVDAVEVRCKSMGDPYCEFIVQPIGRFDFTDPNVSAQLKKN